jgi:hypothetical protein
VQPQAWDFLRGKRERQITAKGYIPKDGCSIKDSCSVIVVLALKTRQSTTLQLYTRTIAPPVPLASSPCAAPALLLLNLSAFQPKGATDEHLLA